VDRAQQESLSTAPVNRDELLALAEDLPGLWDSPSSDTTLKQRIIRILIQEVIADVDERTQEVVLAIHWVGGHHSELRVPKLKTGQHGRSTKAEAVDIVRQMATSYTDEDIALTLNRLRLKTGAGNTWSEARVRSLRSYLKLPVYRPEQQHGRLNMLQAAQRLGVSPTVVRRLIASKILPASQILSGAPWEIDPKAVAAPEVIQATTALKNRDRRHGVPRGEGTPELPGLYEESTEETELP
jgi:plasmid stability protein